MKALIVVASRHGSTQGIAEALAAELRRQGHTVSVTTPADAPPLGTYDTVIVGSAVYIGNWLGEARRYLEQNRDELLTKAVWLFSSGPVGDAAPQPKDQPAHLAELMEQVGARGHRIFRGKLDQQTLGLGERFIMWNVRRLTHDAVKPGDFRDWTTIREWADDISASLQVAAR